MRDTYFGEKTTATCGFDFDARRPKGMIVCKPIHKGHSTSTRGFRLVCLSA